MANVKFEILLETLQQEQERFRQERERRHSDFVQRITSLRARHDSLISDRVRKLSLDGINVDVEDLKLRVRESSMIQDEVKRPDRPKPGKLFAQLGQTGTDTGTDFKIKKLLSFDCRNTDVNAPAVIERGKTHLGFTPKQSFKRIGNKVTTVIKLSSSRRRNSVASLNHLQVPVHVSTLQADFENSSPTMNARSLSFDEYHRHSLGVKSVHNMNGPPRYPKLAIARETTGISKQMLKSPKHRLRSAVAKLESVKRLQLNTVDSR